MATVDAPRARKTSVSGRRNGRRAAAHRRHRRRFRQGGRALIAVSLDTAAPRPGARASFAKLWPAASAGVCCAARAGSQRMARLLRQRARARPSRCCCAARPALGRLRAVPREQAGVKDIPHGRTGATCLSTRPATARTAAAMPWTAASIGYCLRRATCSTTAGRE